MLVPLYSELMKHKIVYTSVDGGHWLEPKSAIFNTLEENEATKEVILQVNGGFVLHEFHETCHSVTLIVLVNSHQR